MTDFRFAEPHWSTALWIVAAVVGLLVYLDRSRSNLLARLVSSTMQARLSCRPSNLRRGASIACFGIASVCMVVALMRPQSGLTYVRTPRVGAQVMVCLDVSKSMLAEDTAPNRLGRAKAEIVDLLSYLEGDQVGLIAFAGRASVLCPLTPDFGFFKLILDGAGPTSVGRGGTRLEEPIRKALDGFRGESDVSRMLILITDGEDHDSHPLDAAKAAAERGIQILAIGFGDEAGSEIRVTDERGVRTTLQDADGKPVLSRLDGETLREMALATEGAYIPAGTGKLDLQSIYKTHIAPLVRGQLDDRGRAIRGEVFQSAVLAAIIFLIAGVVLSSSEAAMPALQRAESVAAMALAGVLVFGSGPAVAAEETENAGESDVPVAAAQPASTPAADPDTAVLPLVSPRERYNQALIILQSDGDKAEQLLTSARREAGIDAELRFRATYNLGWVEVGRADALIEEEPENALQRLETAADWFRMAIDLRKDDEDARINLEVVLRRIAELRDSLTKEDERSIAQRLDDIVIAQREVVASSRSVVNLVSANDDPNAADEHRSEFRDLSMSQRMVLGDAQALATEVLEQIDVIDGKPEEQRTQEERLRSGQLQNLSFYMNRANQRIAQARSQMRRRQASRAFRRASIALEELKRARDQLRSPLEVLDLILADASQTAQWTVATAAQNDLATDRDATPLPAWLDKEFLKDQQQSVTERVMELVAGLQAAVDAQNETEPQDAETPDQQAANAFLKSAAEAMPMLQRGSTSMQQAVTTLSSSNLLETTDHQREGINALTEARERFLDLRGLIELAYASESQISRFLDPFADVPDDQRDQLPELNDEQVEQIGSFVETLQAKNLSRMQRLSEMLEAEIANLQTTSMQVDPSGNPARPEDGNAADKAAEQSQIYQQAIEISGIAVNEMEAVTQSLAESKSMAKADEPPAKQVDSQTAGSPNSPAAKPIDGDVPENESASDDPPDGTKPPAVDKPAVDKPAVGTRPEDQWIVPRTHAAAATDRLQELRRLFFSIVEHLRETAQRQAQLNDETEVIAAQNADEIDAGQLGPISLRQADLSNITEQLAQALEEQAAEAPESFAGQEMDPQQREQFAEAGRRFREAAVLVDEAKSEMQEVGETLTADTPDVSKTRSHQDLALEKLLEALQILQPPNEQPQPQQSQEQQQQQQQDPQESQSQDQQQPQQQLDPSRLLQMVRDREQQRRRDQERRLRMSDEPVAKDW